MRTEFGQKRTSCSCEQCVIACRHMPGYLIPADLVKLIPQEADPFKWGEKYLLASTGAIVRDRKTGREWSIPTIVPAQKSDFSCIFLKDDKCSVHENAPFACAFFKVCGQDSNGLELSMKGLQEVQAAHQDPSSLYARIWKHLWNSGHISQPAAMKRDRLTAELERRGY